MDSVLKSRLLSEAGVFKDRPTVFHEILRVGNFLSEVHSVAVTKREFCNNELDIF